MSAAVPRWKVYLRLGRVSNLPTVWTNVVAGAALAGAGARQSPGALVLTALSMSLFYTGGMFLNDAFDRDIDARERKERPIPAGLVGARHVFAVGFGLLAAGEALLAGAAALQRASAEPGGGAETGLLGPLAGGAALAFAIVLYDLWHKKNPLSPVLMGLCRAITIVTAALVVRRSPPLFPASWADLLGPGPAAFVAPGALVAWCYLIGLTYVAKQESLDRLGRLWPLAFLSVPFVFGAPALVRDPVATVVIACLLAVVAHAIRLLRGKAPDRFPRAVMTLIAGISLLDALLVARAAPGGGWLPVALTALGFPLTLWMQRWVRGT